MPEIPDPHATIDDIVDAGVVAYKRHDYVTSVKRLLEALDQEPKHWRAKLYLGMSYYHGGDILLAAGQFRVLKESCTDQTIRQKAEAALAAMNSAIQEQAQNRMPEMTCTIKKPTVKAIEEIDDGSDIEFVEQSVKNHNH